MHTRSNPEEKTSSTIETRTLDVMVDVEPMVILALALGPGVFWAWYFYHRDKFEPEPAALVIKIFLLGVLVTFPVAFIEGLFGLFIVSQAVRGHRRARRRVQEVLGCAPVRLPECRVR